MIVLQREEIQRQKKKEDDKRNRTKDLHESVTNILKMALAKNEKITPDDIVSS